MHDLKAVYARVPAIVAAMPWLVATVVLAEFAQHAAEIAVGFYGGAGHDVALSPVRLAFGAAKVLAVFATALLASRYVRFEGDVAATRDLDGAFWLGVVLILMSQALVSSLVFALAAGLKAIAGPSLTARLAVVVPLLLLSLVAAVLLTPWYVAMTTRDPELTLGRAIRRGVPRLTGSFALLAGAVLPAMILHYALGYGAMGQPVALVWAMMALDALLVGGMAVLIGSAYAALHARVTSQGRGVPNGASLPVAAPVPTSARWP